MSFIRTDKQARVVRYMLSEGGDYGTTNPHYTATEACVSDAVVHGFFRKLRRAHVLVTDEHEQGGRCCDPDTKALSLGPGPAWAAFVAEAKAKGIPVSSAVDEAGEPASGCVPDPCGYGLMRPVCREVEAGTNNKGVVNGYDAKGGLWFSREVDSEQAREQAEQDAREVPEVCTVEFE